MSKSKFDNFYFKKSISELTEKLLTHRITGSTMDKEWYEALIQHFSKRELTDEQKKMIEHILSTDLETLKNEKLLELSKVEKDSATQISKNYDKYAISSICDWCKGEINKKAIICPHCGKSPKNIDVLKKKVMRCVINGVGWVVSYFIILLIISDLMKDGNLSRERGSIIIIILSPVMVVLLVLEIIKLYRNRKKLDNLLKEYEE